MSDWVGVPDDISKYIGYVYIIRNTINDRLYVGKKLFFKTVRKKPLKGNKNRRRFLIESDWKDYWGSSNELLADIEKHGKENFTRTILHCHRTRWEVSYNELREQVERRVLLDKKYYNGIIRVRLPAFKGSKT